MIDRLIDGWISEKLTDRKWKRGWWIICLNGWQIKSYLAEKKNDKIELCNSIGGLSTNNENITFVVLHCQCWPQLVIALHMWYWSLTTVIECFENDKSKGLKKILQDIDWRKLLEQWLQNYLAWCSPFASGRPARPTFSFLYLHEVIYVLVFIS